MRMKTNEQSGYLAPEIEVNEVIVERGFSISQLENPNEEFGQW